MTRDFREVTTFSVKNPKRARIQPWIVEMSPRITLAGDLTVEIGDLIVRSRPNPGDIWDHPAEFSFRVTHRGQALTNWAIHHTRMWDASGNFDWFLGDARSTNNWTVYRSHRVLDPSQPWRFNANFALDSDFPATNLFSFIVPWPLGGTNQTNFAGLPVNITYVNTYMLAVELPSQPPNDKLTFVSARDASGRDLNAHSGSWRQHGFWRSLEVGQTKGTNVRVTVAIHPNYPATFTLRPRYERAATLP